MFENREQNSRTSNQAKVKELGKEVSKNPKLGLCNSTGGDHMRERTATLGLLHCELARPESFRSRSARLFEGDS